jgi:hypothetical protein
MLDLLRIVMNFTVELDDELESVTVEVGDEDSYRGLSAKFQLSQTAVPQNCPQYLLGWS